MKKFLELSFSGRFRKITLIVSVIILIVLIWLVASTPDSAEKIAVKQLKQDFNVVSYNIDSTSLTYQCCAQAIASNWKKANHARLQITVSYVGSDTETLTFDLSDTRPETEQPGSGFNLTLPGRQSWKVDKVYRQGEEIPENIWSR